MAKNADTRELDGAPEDMVTKDPSDGSATASATDTALLKEVLPVTLPELQGMITELIGPDRASSPA